MDQRWNTEAAHARGRRLHAYRTKAPTGYEAVRPLTFTVREGQVYIDGVLQSDRTIRVEDRIATTMVRVRKVWSDSNYGDRPEKVTFHLLRNAKELTDKQYTVNVDNSSSWTHTWTDLPRYDENGERYNYTVDEEITQGLKMVPTVCPSPRGRTRMVPNTRC